MAGLMDELMGSLGGGGGLGGLLGGLTGGGDSAANEQAANLGVQAILGGLARNSEDPQGAAALAATLDRHDGSVLDDPAAALADPTTLADGQKILGHVFGSDQESVTRNIAAKSGMDVGSIAKMLPALAPVVMGMLGRKKAQGGLDADALSGALKQESSGFDLGDILGSLGGLSGLASGSGSGRDGGGARGGIMSMLKGLLGRR